jgi:transcriptional repressor NrdR
MRCPFCRDPHTGVADTRHLEDETVVLRKRKCHGCKKRFTTYEKIGTTSVRVVKRDGSHVSFDPARLRQGLERACWKRPVDDIQIEELIIKVERDINAAFDTEVESRFIGERVMYYLHGLDQVAYVRFASVYRHFENADDFVRELQQMKQNPDMPSLSSEYLPKKQHSPSPKGKRSRYKEHDGDGETTFPFPSDEEE